MLTLMLMLKLTLTLNAHATVAKNQSLMADKHRLGKHQSKHEPVTDLRVHVQVYNTMVVKRQERNIITYSSLIAAADRAGQWEQGLDIWQHMAGDKCHPNLPA